MSPENYRAGLRSAVRGLWSGVLDFDQFFAMMHDAIRYWLPRAFQDGAADCGIVPADYSPEERIALAQAISRESSFIFRLGEDVERDSRERGGKLTPLLVRLNNWSMRYIDLQNQARLLACEDEKLQWTWQPGKDHCSSCARLHLKVKRASYWRRLGIQPQAPPNPMLKCGGYG